MLRAAGEASTGAAFPTFVIVLLAAAIIYGFGYRVAVNKRANADYKDTKAILPVRRKAYWMTLWAAIKVGFWVILSGALLVAWVAHDARLAAGR
jgi:hypothetical protein